MYDQTLYVRLLLVCCVIAANAAYAEDKTFYTILTPDGPMQVEMPVPSRRAQAAKPAVTAAVTVPKAAVSRSAPLSSDSSESTESPSASSRLAARPISTLAPNALTATAEAVNSPPDTAQPAPSPFIDFAGQQYVDTAYLEQREFNLEGRKRFYSLPDGLGGTQVVERESGVKLSSFVPQLDRPQNVSLAQSYRRVTANALVSLTNQQCLSAVQLKTAKPLNDQPVDFWPKPGFQPKFEFVLAELEPSLLNIHLMSYSATSRRPSYYWPLPIFLDQRGCVLEGVAGFYQSKTAATWLQQSALQGHLHVPKDAHYLLLTPLVEAAELSGETLADHGQLRLTPLRLAAP